MSEQQTMISLSDGSRIPQLGLGVWQASQEQARAAVKAALQAGYRHIDTAAIYENEEGVGAGIRDADVAREQVFVTTKIWNTEQGFASTGRALDASLQRLKMEYVDLLLIHWPAPSRGLYIETWRALIKAKDEGKTRSIGVSNFNPEHLQRLIDETGVSPVLNQIELHPFLQQAELRRCHEALNIQTQSWSPLGQGQALNHPVIGEIARKHGKSSAQVIIRWHLQLGLVVIPKSVTASRIRENHQVFDFALDGNDMAAISTLNSGTRLGPDPLLLQ